MYFLLHTEPFLSLFRRYACGTGVDCLIKAADIVNLGLDKVGSAFAPNWSPPDVQSFERGLNECKRDFAQIAEDYLPHKGCHRVGDFYYNVWKTKAIPEAKAWYQRRDEVLSSVPTSLISVSMPVC